MTFDEAVKYIRANYDEEAILLVLQQAKKLRTTARRTIKHLNGNCDGNCNIIADLEKILLLC